MEIKTEILGIVFAIVIILADVVWFRGSKVYYLLMGVAAFIAAMPFIVATASSSGKEKEIEDMFLEFSRNLVESVKSGTPISKSIVNLGNKNYGKLTIYVRKLANQISIGIPLQRAMRTFAEDTRNNVIKRAIAQISEAERAGGDIGKILESVAYSVAEVEKLKKERKSAIYSLVVQGYIIFFVFIAIILVMEFKIIPLTSDIGNYEVELKGFGALSVSPEKLSNPFLFLIITQGLFTGLVIGKLGEGKLKAGIKHSAVLVIVAFMILTGARALFT